MTQVDFIGALELAVKRRGELPDPAAVRDFSEDVWPLVPSSPNLAIWAELFIERIQMKRKRTQN
jgi:hypothetical protein